MAPKKKSHNALLSLESIQRLGEELRGSKAHINNAAILLSLLLKATDDEEDSVSTQSLLQALISLQTFFVSLFGKGELSLEIYEEAKKRLREEGDGKEKDQAQAIYQTWIWEKYNELIDALLRIIISPSLDSSLQDAAVDALMEFVREEKQGDFSNRIYSKICSSLVLSKDFNNKMIQHIVTDYFNFVDVCCHTCINLKRIIISYCGTKNEDDELTTNGDASLAISIDSLMCNICDILTCLNAPTMGDKDSKTVIECWSKTGDNKRQLDTKNNKSDTDRNSTMIKEVKKMKSKITRVWVTFLRFPLARSVYEKVLGQMHKAIIPNLSNPILLSDFLTSSYNKGGLISVMALSGLFSLITQYGLEYPDFYTKLYALLEPSIFIAKYRARFFELLDTCLKSPLLPSYLAAAFAKKLGRIALKSPPSGALIVIAIVHNLLRRHPSINSLVHKDYVDPNCSVLEDEPDNGKTGLVQGVSQDTEELADRRGVDPFVPCEEDPAKANALQSSLWEIDALRQHYCPIVSRFVASLETDLTVRAKTEELAIKDFSSGSYSTIFAEEVKRRMKQVPLAFYKTCPTKLFLKNSDVLSTLGLTDFHGWTFDSKENHVTDRETEVKASKDQRELPSQNNNIVLDNITEDIVADGGSKVLAKRKKNNNNKKKKRGSQ